MLNVTSEAISTLISSLPFFVAFGLMFMQYHRKRVPALLLFAITWLTFGVYWFTLGLSYLLYNPSLTEFSLVISSFISILIVITYDLIDKEEVGAIKLAIAFLLSTIVIYMVIVYDFIEEGYILSDEKTLIISGPLRVMAAIIGSWSAFFNIYYSTKIYLNSRNSMEHDQIKYAKINLIGILLFGPVSIALFALGVSIKMPWIPIATLAIGSLMSAYSFYKYPNLIFILPFSASRILVIDGDTGLTLFTWNWGNNVNDDILVNDLYSSLIISLNDFIQVLLKRGRIGTIAFEKGEILIEYAESQNLYFVIQSSRYSKIMYSGLGSFTRKFLVQFHNEINEYKNTHMINTNYFDYAIDLVKSSFPMI